MKFTNADAQNFNSLPEGFKKYEYDQIFGIKTLLLYYY